MEGVMKNILGVMVVLALAPNPAPAAQWTAATVEAGQPFGKLDTSRAGRDFKGFWRGLSREERTEIRGRCSVVIGNSARYQTDARALCSELRAEDTFDGGGASGSGGNGGNGGDGGGGSAAAGGRD
jgi:hypothetical protein